MNKKSAIEWIKNLFKLKSPCCKMAMENVGIHYHIGSEHLIYKCTKCEEKWM